MTRFRLTSAIPATSQSGGDRIVFHNQPSTFTPTDNEPTELERREPFYPNREPDTLLRCGCKIPWPIIVLLGTGGKVECDLHGPQSVAEKEKARARKASKKWHDTHNQSSLLPDLPPF